MLSARNIALENYPKVCAANCGIDDARILQVHHIDGKNSNNDVSNLMLLCPTCHERVTKKIWKVDELSRAVVHVYTPVGLVEVTPSASPLPAVAVEQLVSFRDQVPTFERSNNIPYILSMDGKSEAYYFLCHIPAKQALDLIDLEAVIDPDEQEEYRANREVLVGHRSYADMQRDAQNGREFVDIVVEYNTAYRDESPLKMLGGQHRARALEGALANEPDRYHVFRVYLALTKEQRADISIICNTNIAISNDLLDRMQETLLGAQLRDWCQAVGLLKQGTDFADRRSTEGVLTVRMARTITVNYWKAAQAQQDIWHVAHHPEICKAGDTGGDYGRLRLDPDMWKDAEFTRAGRELAELHRTQQRCCESDAELRKTAEFGNKAITPAVLSAWVYVAGLLRGDTQHLDTHYSLSRRWGDTKDPLNVTGMTHTSHADDPPTYRGLGTRMGPKERGRLVQVFLLHAEGTYGEALSSQLLKAGVKEYHSKLTAAEAEEAKRGARAAARKGMPVQP